MKNKRRGRPKKLDSEKVLSNDLYPTQWDKIVAEASLQGITPALMHRKIVDWYFDGHEPEVIASPDGFETLQSHNNHKKPIKTKQTKEKIK